MATGLTDTGLSIPTADEIKTELETALKSAFGESIDLDPSGPFGQLVGILADREADLWEQLAAVKEAFNPDGSTGLQLDELSAITGTVREGATSSSALVTLMGDLNTEVPAGSSMSTLSTSIQFDTSTDATLLAASAWAATTAYAVGDKVASVSNIYGTTSSGISGSTTLSGTSSSIADGSVVWDYLGTADAYSDVPCLATLTGPSVALSGDITVIETPITGWDTCVNTEDATVGRDTETDAELRVKRVVELSARSASTYGGVNAAVSDVDDVTLVYIFENNTTVTDSDGVPPKAFETLVVGGLDSDIALVLFDSKPIGIQAYGTTEVVLSDSQGTLQTVGFTRPTDINVYVTVNLIIDPYEYPDDGDTLVLNQILSLSGTTVPGKDVVSSKIKSLCFGVSGVLDVTTAYIDTSVTPTTETTISIGLKQLADYDSSRIIINTTEGNP